jgi:hypothetical protein
VPTAATALVDRLVAALLDEEQGRRAVHEALTEQGSLLRELRAAGVPATRVAHRILAARGVALPVRDRLRLAERLRKRAWRTLRPVDLAASHGQPRLAGPRSDRALTPGKEDVMAGKIVKRTTTTVEEFEDEDGDEEVEEDGDEVEEEAEAEDEPAPRRRAKASRK